MHDLENHHSSVVLLLIHKLSTNPLCSTQACKVDGLSLSFCQVYLVIKALQAGLGVMARKASQAHQVIAVEQV